MHLFLNLGIFYVLVVNLFWLKILPLIIALPKSMFHLNSMSDLYYTCDECIMFVGFDKMNSMID